MMEGSFAQSIQALRRSKVRYFLPDPSALAMIRIWGIRRREGPEYTVPSCRYGSYVPAHAHVRTFARRAQEMDLAPIAGKHKPLPQRWVARGRRTVTSWPWSWLAAWSHGFWQILTALTMLVTNLIRVHAMSHIFREAPKALHTLVLTSPHLSTDFLKI